MKSVFSIPHRILSTLLLCITLLLANISFAGELEDLTFKANQGNALAQFSLGKMNDKGQGLPQDHKQAVMWFTKAANQGYAKAQSNLGVMYANGEGVPQDYKQALMWFSKAANQGDAAAQYNVGSINMDGLGMPQDHKHAYVWYSLAAANGYSDAPKWRDIAASKLTPQQLAEAQQQAKELFDKIEANKPK